MSDNQNRYIVFRDGETYGPLAGSKIVAVADTLRGDAVDAAISARCRHSDDEEGAGVTVLYTFRGTEPDADTLGELAGIAALTRDSIDVEASRVDRLDDALDHAQNAFWLCFAAYFPEVTTGDLDPLTALAFTRAAEEWLAVNWPDDDAGDDPPPR